MAMSPAFPQSLTLFEPNKLEISRVVVIQKIVEIQGNDNYARINQNEKGVAPSPRNNALKLQKDLYFLIQLWLCVDFLLHHHNCQPPQFNLDSP